MSTVDEQLLQPPLPPQPHRISTSCPRHPDDHFTGFCPSCLRDRLSVLDHSASTSAAGPKSTSSALKSIFHSSAAATNNSNAVGERTTLRTRPGSFLPKLRRTQSFSVGKNDAGLGFAGNFEPQRKSCDVRNTLWSLFSQEDGKRAAAAANFTGDSSSSSSQARPGIGADQVEGKFSSSNGFVIELKSEGDCERDVVFEEVEKQEEEREDRLHPVEAEIEEIENPIALNTNISNSKFPSAEQWESMEAEKLKFKQVKNHTDLHSQAKKAGGKDLKELAGSFWSAASVFSKKLKAWTRKNSKQKKHSGGRTEQVVSKKSNAGRSYRETQSEIADYGNGRRSCDIDPRFSIVAGRMSLDAGRMSFDDPRYSFDEPRASWDGYLIGGGRLSNFQRMGMGVPPMVSVMENRPPMMASRKDNLIALEEPRRSIHEDEGVPGGAAETKDYYLNSSSRRRKSLDRSSSIRRTSAAVVAEIDEMKRAPCNAKVTPAAGEYLHCGSAKGAMGVDTVLRDSNPNSFRDHCSESFDRGFRDSASVIGSTSDRKVVKKSRSWRSWNIWGLIARRGSNKGEDDDMYNRDNGVERSYSKSWQERGRDGIGVDPRGALSRHVFRSNSSVSWRNSDSNSTIGPIGGSSRKGIAETNGHAKKMSNEFVLARNRSARYSPNCVENGQLRFYMTPTGGSRRGPTAKAKEAAYSRTKAGSMLY